MTATTLEYSVLMALGCRWIAGRISEILGNEDDVVIELCFNLLEGTRYVCCMDRGSIYVPLRFMVSSLTHWCTITSLTSSHFRFNSLDFLIKTLRNFAKSYGLFVLAARRILRVFRKSF